MASRHKVQIQVAVIAAVLLAIIVGHFVQKGKTRSGNRQQPARVASYYATKLLVKPFVQREGISEESEVGERTTVVKDVAYAVLTNPTQVAFCNVQVQMDSTADGERSVETAPAAFLYENHPFLGPSETQKAVLGGYDPSSRLQVWSMAVISATPCQANDEGENLRVHP